MEVALNFCYSTAVFNLENLYLVGLAILAFAALALGGLLYDTRRKFRRLFKAEMPETHAEALGQLLRRLQLAEAELAELGSRTETLEAIGQASFQKFGFVRFNPFADTGGDQSFALALLDRKNNGIVILSLYGREGTRVYAKSIENGAPKQQLSEEEKKVLAQAIQR